MSIVQTLPFPNVTDKDGRPVIFTYSLYGENGRQYQYVSLCPFCTGNHLHGYGPGDHGRRISHCGGRKPLEYRLSRTSLEYLLVCLGEIPPLVKRHYNKRIDWQE